MRDIVLCLKLVLSEEADNDDDEDEGWKIWKVGRL